MSAERVEELLSRVTEYCSRRYYDKLLGKCSGSGRALLIEAIKHSKDDDALRKLCSYKMIECYLYSRGIYCVSKPRIFLIYNVLNTILLLKSSINKILSLNEFDDEDEVFDDNGEFNGEKWESSIRDREKQVNDLLKQIIKISIKISEPDIANTISILKAVSLIDVNLSRIDIRKDAEEIILLGLNKNNINSVEHNITHIEIELSRLRSQETDVVNAIAAQTPRLPHGISLTDQLTSIRSTIEEKMTDLLEHTIIFKQLHKQLQDYECCEDMEE